MGVVAVDRTRLASRCPAPLGAVELARGKRVMPHVSCDASSLVKSHGPV